MSGAIHPLPQYVFVAWCSVKSTGATLPLPLNRRINLPQESGRPYFTTPGSAFSEFQSSAGAVLPSIRLLVLTRTKEIYMHHICSLHDDFYKM
jgi:hypothetical protein